MSDREQNHLDVMTDMVDNHYSPGCYEQTIRSAVSTYYHTNLVSLIEERIGDGEPLDVLLADTYHREKLNLEPRKL